MCSSLSYMPAHPATDLQEERGVLEFELRASRMLNGLQMNYIPNHYTPPAPPPNFPKGYIKYKLMFLELE